MKSDGTTPYTPIQLTAALYGDFDHDSVSDDSDDVTRFNDSFPCDLDSCDKQGDAYDPLVDWNCDGVVNCDDRAQFLTNWPTATGLDDDNCP